MIYKGGQSCVGGLTRELEVLLECGVEERVAYVDETERCHYEMLLQSPAACTKGDMTELEQLRLMLAAAVDGRTEGEGPAL
jgi:hypothetical protein